jgi:threonine dehydrogenase-like Zn-dependent dehydrogenase
MEEICWQQKADSFHTTLVQPTVPFPDGGVTAALLGLGVLGLCAARRHLT